MHKCDLLTDGKRGFPNETYFLLEKIDQGFLTVVSSEVSKKLFDPAGIFEHLASQHVREENVEEMPLDRS